MHEQIYEHLSMTSALKQKKKTMRCTDLKTQNKSYTNLIYNAPLLA